MSKFTWFTGRGPALTQQQLQRRQALSAPAPLDERPLHQQRIVVLDLETTGLNMRRDLVLAIGAVVIDHGAIDFAEQFECTLRRPDHQASASTLIHGIAPSEVARGVDPAEALLDFMEFVGSSPLLAFHAGFDQRMLGRALRQSLDYRLQHNFFDVAEIAPCSARRHACVRADWMSGSPSSACRCNSATTPAPTRWSPPSWR